MLKIKDGYIEIPYNDTIFPKTDATMEVFFKLYNDRNLEYDTLLSCTQNGGYALNFYEGGTEKIACAFYNNGYKQLVVDNNDLLKDKINHVVCSFKSNDKFRLYLNGKEIDSMDVGDGLGYPSGCNLIIGSEYLDESREQFKNGEILCCRIWKKALSGKDVIDYSHMDKINNDDLVGNWIMSDEYVNDKKLIDLSKYHNDGNIVGDVTIDNNTYNVFRKYVILSSNKIYTININDNNKITMEDNINFKNSNNIQLINKNIKNISKLLPYSIIHD